MKLKKNSEKKAGTASSKNNAKIDTVKVLQNDTPFFIKEAYKALRTNIIFSLPTDECKKIAITSSLAGEGKSTNCLNLAISFAQMGTKTLIIDSDLRRPNVAKLLDEKASPGLSNVLVGLSSLKDAINHTKYENLDAIFAGDIPPNPTELLISNKMSEILDALSADYDYIFIDCPPVNVVTDASIISKYVSGMILVVRQGETAKDEVLDAKKQLDLAGAKLIGTILNDASEVNARYGYHKKKYYKYLSFGTKSRKAYIDEYISENEKRASKEK